MGGQLSHGLGLVGVASLLCQFLQDLGGGQGSRRAVQALKAKTHLHTSGRKDVKERFFFLGHLLPGDLRQLLIVLNDGPQEKVSAGVPECSLGIWLTFSQLEEGLQWFGKNYTSFLP